MHIEVQDFYHVIQMIFSWKKNAKSRVYENPLEILPPDIRAIYQIDGLIA